MAKNPCGKTRPVDRPYEIWEKGDFIYHVLKKYQAPRNEEKNPYSRWFVAVKSPYTHGNWEYGDEYAVNVKKGRLVKTDYDEQESAHADTK